MSSLAPGAKVRVADRLDSHDKRGYLLEAIRRPGAVGVVLKAHDSHGACYSVQHEDGAVGCYDPDELARLESSE